MPLSALLFLPLAFQAGNAPPLPRAPLEIPRRKAEARVDAPPLSRLQQCLDLTRTAPVAADLQARSWLDSVQGSARAQPGRCLGVALSAQAQWDDAAAAFLAARDTSAANDKNEMARLGGMAGNAALAAGRADAALAALDRAHRDALAAGDRALAASLAIDRARALVSLGRDADAATALAEARAGAAQDPSAWLLSATLARRQGKLVEAQTQIEQAALLAPLDPEIGLEAGVIAALAGRDEAARKSFSSVIRAAPDSDFAVRAQRYLDQLGALAAPSRP